VSDKTHKTAVVIIPPEDVWEPVQAIRRQHDRQVHRWMPHITLLYPFRPRRAFDKVAERFSSACEAIQPFALRLAKLHTFQHGKQNFTIWLAPEDRGMIAGLQTTLWQEVPECDDVRRFENGFTPHLSVGQSRGREPTEKLVAELQGRWIPLQFQVAEICLIWRGDPPDDVFRIDRRISLGKTGKNHV